MPIYTFKVRIDTFGPTGRDLTATLLMPMVAAMELATEYVYRNTGHEFDLTRHSPEVFQYIIWECFQRQKRQYELDRAILKAGRL